MRINDIGRGDNELRKLTPEDFHHLHIDNPTEIYLDRIEHSIRITKGDEDILLTPDTLRKMFDFLKSNEENY